MNTPSEPQPQRQNIDKRSAPYVSFGDKGTTATAGLYGSLIRICRPVPVNHLHSGIVALGLLDGGQACYASLRADKFLRNAQSVTSGFGLRVLNAPRPQSSPVTEFLGDRWPVISYITDGDCQVSVRLWCQQNVTIQHMQIQNPMRASESPKVGLDVNFCLQDLDCVEKRDDLEVEYHRAPHGYGVIVMEKNKNIKSHGERICVLISVFMNGKGQKIHFKNKNDLIKMPAFSEPEVEFTAVFKIFMGTRKLDWQSFMVSKTDVYCDPLPTVPAGLDSSLSQDRQLIWHFRRNLEHILSVCSIPVDVLTAQDDSSLSANQNEKLQAPMITIQPPTGREEVLHPNRPVQPIQPIALTCGDFGDHHISISGS
ncbi:uncharacterized protein N7483_009644 [Penicillium malachiteum]|uniref:uncharacterized protein n=1 Tax=Penicillium malachiteum TaxID=1324776 RepID=UPI0025480D19|nr:uncharacterized protein N7483_009644 [Penicillium malachiteum]KAJ5721710.1 hypothetical protein N7483_009644 [Penicillium malachiteum]